MNPDIIHANVDPDLADLAPSYLEKRKIEISLIPQSIQQNDFFSIQQIGHRLRGNAALFGLDWLQDKGSELEAAAKTQQRDFILALSEEMSAFLDKVQFVYSQHD